MHTISRGKSFEEMRTVYNNSSREKLPSKLVWSAKNLPWNIIWDITLEKQLNERV